MKFEAPLCLLWEHSLKLDCRGVSTTNDKCGLHPSVEHSIDECTEFKHYVQIHTYLVHPLATLIK